MKTITVGTAKSEPGKLTYGHIDAMDLPTGIVDKIPVIIAQGTEEGPTFFLTANIHGNELTGIAIIHEVMNEDLAKSLKGTVVAIPTQNPAGFRRYARYPDYDERDPNRAFPEGRFAKKEEDDEDKKYPKPYEQVASKLYEYFDKHADYHLDFHNHTLRSIPYSILDRIFYKDDSDKEEAEKLAEQQKGMVEAFGMFGSADFPAKKYINLKYHRSASGAVLNSLRRPAFTVELGSNNVLVPEVVAESIKGTRNVLRWAGMLDGPMEEISDFGIGRPQKRVRRIEHPRAPQSGIVKLLVEPGQLVKAGDPIARFTDIHGRPIGDGFIRTEQDGIMIALRDKMDVYPNDIVSEMGVEDDEPIIAQYPPPKE
jgi:predicted deacylase